MFVHEQFDNSAFDVVADEPHFSSVGPSDHAMASRPAEALEHKGTCLRSPLL